MRLIGVCAAKNEGDVIEWFVRHNLQFLDRLIVLDHDSVDNTGAILRALATEGLPLTLARSRAMTFKHDRLMEGLVDRALEREPADFVFLLDADEFLVAESRSALERSLVSLPPQTLGSLQWRTHLPSPGAGPLFERMRQRPVSETNVMRKVILPSIPNPAGRWQIAPGNHAARFRDAAGWVQPEMPELRDVKLAHLPLRSPAQALSKSLIGWLGWRLSYGNLGIPGADRMGWHWRQWSEGFLREGRWPTWAQLRRDALRVYAFDIEADAFDVDSIALLDDPLPEPPGMRHLSQGDADPTRNLAAWGAAMVESLLAERRNSTPRRT
jgi:hypothetical protein